MTELKRLQWQEKNLTTSINALVVQLKRVQLDLQKARTLDNQRKEVLSEQG